MIHKLSAPKFAIIYVFFIDIRMFTIADPSTAKHDLAHYTIASYLIQNQDVS